MSTSPAYCLSVSGFGDSITQGHIPNPGSGRRIGGYVPSLEKHLTNAHGKSFVYNFGKGGETTPEGVNRIDNVLKSLNTKFILIMEGTNDKTHGLSRPTTYRNLRTMIDKSKSSGVIPIIATLTPDTIVGHENKRIQSTYNVAIKTEIAPENNIVACDQYAAMAPRWSELSDDGLHPNTEGYKVMAYAWYKCINKAISNSNQQNEEDEGQGCFINAVTSDSFLESFINWTKNSDDAGFLHQK